MEKDVRPRPGGELTSQQFQQQLNQWFEQHGILDNLRSHLRSLMVTVLQRTEFALRPVQRTSPKAQSVNLLVAEYLLKQGCHYTLSVLTSEVSSLADFGSGSVAVRSKAKNVGRARTDGKYHFEEDEVIEILNSLGFSPCEEHLRNLSDRYMQRKDEESLLECLLDLMRNLQLRQSSSRCEADGRSRLSKEWLVQVSDVLVRARAKSLQLSTAQEMLSKITENEIKRTSEEESMRQMVLLTEREKRIQEYLKGHENEIMERLQAAEGELNARRETIDRELNDRRQHLERIAFEWQDKHEEIMSMSKNYASVKAENKSFRSALDRMELEIAELRLEVKAKTEMIDRLEAEKATYISHVREYLKRSNRKGSEMTQNEHIVTREAREKARSERESNLGDRTCSDQLLSGRRDDFGSSESSSFADDAVLSRVKSRLQLLEEESNLISKKYQRFRHRYDDLISRSDSETESSRERGTKISDGGEVAKESAAVTAADFATESRVAPRRRRDRERSVSTENVFRPSSEAEAAQPKKPAAEEQPKGIVPTKRQQKNHEYYIRSRNLLQILEKSTGIAEAFSPESTSDVSLGDSASNECSKRSPEVAATGGDVPEREPDEGRVADGPAPGERDRVRDSKPELTNSQCLNLLREATRFSDAESEEDEIPASPRDANVKKS